MRFGFDPNDPCFLNLPEQPPPAGFLDVHAGRLETEMVWGHFPAVVRQEVSRTLPPTNLRREDLNIWRQGGEYARRMTPHGYFGAPAEADPERGRALAEEQASLMAAAILRRLEKEGRRP